MGLGGRLLRAVPPATRRRLAAALTAAPPAPPGGTAGRRAAREASFPYLSGDGLRLLADVLVEDGRPDGGPSAGGMGAGIVFTQPHVARSEEGLARIVAALSRVESTGARPTLIIHNGDARVEASTLGELASRCREVFCVNVDDGMPGVTPVPIGLENVHRGRGGSARSHLALELGRPRDIPVLGCFNSTTNPALRFPIQRAMEASRHGFVLPGLSNTQHLALVARSLFVVSPPGNGPDCHRTWEAMAGGAVPVVLRGSLATSLTDDAPIHVVDDVREVLEMDDGELRDLHAHLSRRDHRISLLAHWIVRILGRAD